MQYLTSYPFILGEVIATILKDLDCHSQSALIAVKAIGHFLFSSEPLCTHLISSLDKSAKLAVLASLQRILVETLDVKAKTAVLWAICNIVLNSLGDLNAVLKSGIIANLSLACRDKDRSVRAEAINTIANLIIKLSIAVEYQTLRSLVM